VRAEHSGKVDVRLPVQRALGRLGDTHPHREPFQDLELSFAKRAEPDLQVVEQGKWFQIALYHATTSGMKSGTPGKPFPEDVALKNSAVEALATIRPGSPARVLFSWIRDHAEGEINRAHLEAELLEESE
jgi:hypothetical protein